MKKASIVLTVLSLGLFSVGCSTTDSTVHTKQGAVKGGLLGAAAGGIIGHQSGRGLEGAAIGAGAGAVGGGLLGSAQDEKADRESDY